MNDDSFYLPPEIFDNAEFKRGMDSFISPDGKAVRFIISHEGDPLTADGIDRIDAIKQAAKEALRALPSKDPGSISVAPRRSTRTCRRATITTS